MVDNKISIENQCEKQCGHWNHVHMCPYWKCDSIFINNAQVQEDGSFIAVDGSNRCGRTFLGQGAMMTGVKVHSHLFNGIKHT